MKVGNNVQILVVEDDPVQMQVLIDKLTENNKSLNIKQFESGEKLMSYLSVEKKCSKKYYLVLDYFLQTEVNKEGHNGIDVIKLLQNGYSYIKTIIFSAYEADGDLKFDTLVNDHPNVIGVVKKSDFAFSTLQNIIRFDYINQVFHLKRKRFVIARNLFFGFLAIAVLYLVFFQIL